VKSRWHRANDADQAPELGPSVHPSGPPANDDAALLERVTHRARVGRRGVEIAPVSRRRRDLEIGCRRNACRPSRWRGSSCFVVHVPDGYVRRAPRCCRGRASIKVKYKTTAGETAEAQFVGR